MNNLVRSTLLNEEYQLIKHKSGLDIYVFPKNLSVSYAIIAAKFGSIDNCFKIGNGPDWIRIPDGTAHFLEHKMFENADGEDTFIKFSRTGADANAFTSFRDTAYLYSCTENLYESLEILLKSTFEPYFTKENVKKEQGIIAQEIRMGEDDPGDTLFRDLLCCLYEKSSLRLDIAGSVESISKITPEILYNCHQAFYNPQNMILCVCGQAETQSVLSVVNRVISDSKPIPVQSYYETELPEAFQKRSERKMKISKPLFCIGVKDIDISDSADERMRKYAAMQIIASVYFGKSSEFYNRLYSDGLISPSFSCWIQHNRAFSFFTLSGDSKDPEQIFDAFCSYTQKITSESLINEDFERCRRVLYSHFVRLFDSTEEIANALAADFAIDVGNIFKYGDILNEITREYTEKILKSFFLPSSFAMSVIRPL